jgi:hypothetical protein
VQKLGDDYSSTSSTSPKKAVGNREHQHQHRRTFTPMLIDPPGPCTAGSDEGMFSKSRNKSSVISPLIFNSSSSSTETLDLSRSTSTSNSSTSSLSSLCANSGKGESTSRAPWSDGAVDSCSYGDAVDDGTTSSSTSTSTSATGLYISCDARADEDAVSAVLVVECSRSTTSSSRSTATTGGPRWATIISTLRGCRSQSSMQQAVIDECPTFPWSPDNSRHGGESLSRFSSPGPVGDFHMLQCTGADDADVEQRAQMFGMHIHSYCLFENVLRAGADVTMRHSGAPKKRSGRSSRPTESLVTLFMEGSMPQDLRLCWCKPGKARLVGNNKKRIVFTDICSVHVRGHARSTNHMVTISTDSTFSSIQFEVENDFQGDVLRLGFSSLAKHLKSIGQGSLF